jgi:hypothetical protein
MDLKGVETVDLLAVGHWSFSRLMRLASRPHRRGDVRGWLW